MAEFVLRYHDTGTYQADDIVDASNNRRIWQVHAEMLCHPWRFPVTSCGLRPGGGLSQLWFELTHEYRFEREGRKRVRRVNIATGEFQIFGQTPRHGGQYIDVPLFLKRRLAHKDDSGKPLHDVFGRPGHEVWYGGHIDLSPANIDRLWEAIYQQFGLHKRDYSFWPTGEKEYTNYLVVPVTDFSDEQRTEYCSEALWNGEVAMKRRWRVDWRQILPSAVTEEDVLDMKTAIDLRRFMEPLDHAEIARRKPVIFLPPYGELDLITIPLREQKGVLRPTDLLVRRPSRVQLETVPMNLLVFGRSRPTDRQLQLLCGGAA